MGNLKGVLGLAGVVEIFVQLFLLPGLLLSAYLQRCLLGEAGCLSTTDCSGWAGYEELNWMRGRMR